MPFPSRFRGFPGPTPPRRTRTKRTVLCASCGRHVAKRGRVCAPHFKKGSAQTCPGSNAPPHVSWIERADPIPLDERTHVAATRWKLGCGLPRIGMDRELIVDAEPPTCPGCRKHLRDVEESARLVREHFQRHEVEKQADW
jgi:predicted amidophosphoribosyltransferase